MLLVILRLYVDLQLHVKWKVCKYMFGDGVGEGRDKDHGCHWTVILNTLFLFKVCIIFGFSWSLSHNTLKSYNRWIHMGVRSGNFFESLECKVCKIKVCKLFWYWCKIERLDVMFNHFLSFFQAVCFLLKDENLDFYFDL